MKQLFYSMVLILSAFVVNAQSIDGVWEEVSTPGHKNSTIVICQIDDQVYLTASWYFNGQHIVWKGEGFRDGNKIEYLIVHSKYVTGWATKANHKLSVSSDGKTLNGSWTNTRNESGTLKFIKKEN